MKKAQEHTESNTDLKDLSPAFFSRTKIAWGTSKDEIWEELSAHLEEDTSLNSKSRFILPNRQWIALAASVAILLAVGGFMRIYTEKTVCAAGEHRSIQLPDGSIVELNASTIISYHPYWWRFSRRLDLEGEAFFNVKEGKQFHVVSTRATTEVLGTTFNVYARNNRYSVSCQSGQVRITSSLTHEMITLSPNERAELNQSGAFNISGFEEVHSTPGWINSHLLFAAEPLRLGFDEIERQYGIIIETPEDMHYLFSGNFSIDGSVENVISLICRPFDLVYEQKSSTKYLIHPPQTD